MTQNHHALAGHAYAPALPTAAPLFGQFLCKRWDGAGCGNRAERYKAVRETVSTLMPHASQAGDCVLAGRMQPSRLARLSNTMRTHNKSTQAELWVNTNLNRLCKGEAHTTCHWHVHASQTVGPRGITCNDDAVSLFLRCQATAESVKVKLRLHLVESRRAP